MKIRTATAILLAALLPAAAQQDVGALKVTVLEGEGAVNNIRAKKAVPPSVEVRDGKGQPVARAEVIFELPYAGPGGTFGQGMRYRTVRTDEQGRATATEYAPNQYPGNFNIRVSVTAGSRTANTVIAQSNGYGVDPEAKSSKKTWWIVLGLAAAGGIVGGVAATRGGKSSAVTTTPITVGTGVISVGGPK